MHDNLNRFIILSEAKKKKKRKNTHSETKIQSQCNQNAEKKITDYSSNQLGSRKFFFLLFNYKSQMESNDVTTYLKHDDVREWNKIF